MAIKSNDKISPAEKGAAGMVMARNEDDMIGAPKFHAEVECVGPEGSKWKEKWNNAVQTMGKIDLMNQYFGRAAAAPAYNTWYVGLHSYSATVATLTAMNQWTGSEVAGYGANRLSFSMANNIATQSSTWSLSYAFNTGTWTVSGLAVCNSAANGISGTAGVIYSLGMFNASSRQVMSADTLNVTLTLSMQ